MVRQISGRNMMKSRVLLRAEGERKPVLEDLEMCFKALVAARDWKGKDTFQSLMDDVSVEVK